MSLLRSLESKGLVEQRESEADRRARLVRLTPPGDKLFAELRPAAIAGQQQVPTVLLPAERDVLLDLLLRVIEGNPDLARPWAGRESAWFP